MIGEIMLTILEPLVDIAWLSCRYESLVERSEELEHDLIRKRFVAGNRAH